ncbi:MAG: acyltransferase family protein [Acetobacteraceae bacterium]|nr:acyltransferase family protein [Acetobacteraceae bacterium]
MPDQFSAPARIAWIDTAKGVGIILVVVSHVCVSVAGGGLTWFLFLFHMPFFFILAGILTRAAPPRQLLEKRARSLLVPYAAFLILLGGLLVAKDQYAGGGLANDLLSLAYGGTRLGGFLGVFWFVTCLFGAQLTFNAVLTASPRAFGPGTLSVLIACLATATVLSGHPGPLAMGVVPFAVVMLGVGYAYRSFRGPNWPVVAAAILVATSLLAATRSMAFHLDMKQAEYGPPLTGALLAIALSLLLLELCKGLDRVAVLGPLLRRTGQASLFIMFMHQTVHFSLAKFLSAEPAIAVMSLAVPMLAFELVRRSRHLSPVLLGVPRADIRTGSPAFRAQFARAA